MGPSPEHLGQHVSIPCKSSEQGKDKFGKIALQITILHYGLVDDTVLECYSMQKECFSNHLMPNHVIIIVLESS